MKRRLVSLVMAFVMVFTLIPTTVVTAWAISHTITIQTEGSGTVTPDSLSVGMSYSATSGKNDPTLVIEGAQNTGGTVTATANTGWHFVEWKSAPSSGETSSWSGPFGVDSTFTAVFEEDAPTAYTVSTASNIEHGTVTLSTTTTVSGTVVTVTATPDSGYALDAVTITRSEGGADVTEEVGYSNGQFTMPAYNVIVNATFTAKPHTHCDCGSTTCGTENGHNQNQEWTEWTATDSLPTGNGYYYLTADVTLTSSCWLTDGTHLCLNGHVVTLSGEYSYIGISTNSAAVITDCTKTPHKFTTATNAAWTLNETEGNYTVYGGVIYGGTGSSYSAVRNFGTATLTNINIVGHTTINAQGYGTAVHNVDNSNAKLALVGCTLAGNRASDNSWGYGGAAYNGTGGTMILEKCTVTGNYAQKNGGAFWEYRGKLTKLTLCTVTDNTSPVCGGLQINGGAWELQSCVITGNTNTGNSDNGGGVYYGGSGSLTLGGTTRITGNKSGTGSNAKDSNLYLSGGKVTVDGLTDGAEIYVTSSSGSSSYPVAITNESSADYSKYFKSDNASYVALNTGDDDQQVVKLSLPPVANVTVGGVTTGCSSFAEAVTQAVSNSASGNVATITMLQDITLTEPVTFSGGNVVLDLKGHVLNNTYVNLSSYDASLNVNAGAALQIVDSDPTVPHYFTYTAAGGESPTPWTLNTTSTVEEKAAAITVDQVSTQTDVGTLIKVSGGVITCPIGFGIKNKGTATLTDINIIGCKCPSINASGSAVDNRGTMTMTGCLVAGNRGYYYGYTSSVHNEGALTMTACKVIANSSYKVSGGGVRNYGGTATLTNCDINYNTAYSSSGNSFGGGVANLNRAVGEVHDGVMTMTGCHIIGNESDGGGGVFNCSLLTMKSCTVSGNTSDSGCTRSLGSQSAGSDGGGVSSFQGDYNRVSLIMTDCAITNNAVLGSGNSSGGGVSNRGYSLEVGEPGEMILTNCVITGNTAKQREGGGVSNVLANATLTNCTICNNHSETSSGGGVFNDGNMVLDDVIVTGNDAGSNGGGAYYYTSDDEGHSLILAGNTKITDNIADSKTSNLYIYYRYGGGTMALRDDFTGAVGVALYNPPTYSYTNKDITTAANSKDFSGNFTSDNSKYAIVNSGSDSAQQVQMTLPCTLPDKVGGFNANYYYKMTADKTYNSAVTIPTGDAVTIDLNGYVLTADITVPNGASLIITDSGSTAEHTYYNNDGLWELNGGTVSGTLYGGVVLGKITNDGGTVTLKGGNMLRGVETNNSSVTVSGKTKINGNTVGAVAGATPCNLKLTEGAVVTVGSGFSGEIHVTNPSVTIGNPMPITAPASRDWSANFVSDDPELTVLTQGSGSNQQVYLSAAHAHGSQVYEKITTSASLTDLFTKGGCGYLDADVTANADLTVGSGKTVTLCLNGHALNLNGHHIVNNGNLTIEDHAENVKRHFFTYSTQTNWATATSASGAAAVEDITSATTPGTTVYVSGGVIYGGAANDTDWKSVAAYGGAIYNKGNATLTNVNLVGNKASNYYGGGVYNNEGTLTMTGCTVSGNTAYQNGGGVYNGEDATLTMTGCTVSGNTANSGGGVRNDGEFTMTGGSVSYNKANQHGGGVYNSKTLTMTDCAVSGNKANYHGGGVYNTETLTMTGCTVSGNKAGGVGGGVRNSGAITMSGHTTITGNTIGGTTANNLYLSGTTATLTDTFSGTVGVTMKTAGAFTNTGVTAAQAKCFTSDNDSYMVVYDAVAQKLCVIDKNAVAAVVTSGGTKTEYKNTINEAWTTAIGADMATITMLNNATATDALTVDASKTVTLDLNDHALNLNGHHIVNNGNLTVMDSAASKTTRYWATDTDEKWIPTEDTTTGLTTTGGIITGGNAEEGGAIYNKGNATLTNINIVGNAATAYDGGAIYNRGHATLTNVNIVGNVAKETCGGVCNGMGATFVMVNSHIDYNKANYGGGVANNGTFTMTGSSIDGNKATIITGGVSNNGTFTMTDSSIDGNTAGADTGGVSNDGTFTMTGSSIDGNTAVRDIGGVTNGDHGTFTMTDSSISHNKAASYAGGVCNNGAITMSGHTTITGNTIEGTTEKNLYLYFTTATLTDTFSGTVGVTLESYDIAFTTAGVMASQTDCFTSDNNSWQVVYDAVAQKLCLIPKNTVATVVTSGGTETEYKNSINEAWTTAIGADMATITMLNNATANGTLSAIGSGKTVTLDLNGHALNLNGKNITNNGNLTVTDSATDKTTRYWATDPNGKWIIPTTEMDATHTAARSTVGGVIYGGSAATGGAIYNNGMATLTDISIVGNTAEECGGGVYNDEDSTFVMVGGSIVGNTVTAEEDYVYGGGVYNDGSFYMNGGSISYNTATTDSGDGCGGGVYNHYGATFTMNGGSIDHNTATVNGGSVYGGGVYNYETTFTMTNGSIDHNTATANGGDSDGGGVYNTYGTTFTMTGGSIDHNTATTDSGDGYGGGVCNKGEFTMTGGSVSHNTTTGSNNGIGGGVYNEAVFTMKSCTVSDNTATANSGIGWGGGVYNQAVFTMTGCTVSGNAATANSNYCGYGGGVYNAGGSTFAMTGGSIDDNEALIAGGVYNCNNFTMNGGSITGNKATGTDAYAGGVLNDYVFIVSSDSNITGNKASNTDSNLYTVKNHSITVAADFCGSAGVTLIHDRNSDTCVEGDFTNVLSPASATDYVKNGNFVPDDDDYIVVKTAANKLALLNPSTKAAKVETASGTNYYPTINAAWTAANATNVTVATITMLNNATATDTLTVNSGKTVTLDLNGKVLNLNGKNIVNNGNLTVKTTDKTKVHKFTTATDAAWTLDENGNYTVTGGVITGGYAEHGGAINNNGTATLTDVNIVGNRAKHGGAIFTGSNSHAGTLTINSANIVGNYAMTDSDGGYGGGIQVYAGTATMNGGSISYNVSDNCGAGVYVQGDGTFTLTSGKITGNITKLSGAVYVLGTFTMAGGEISNNSAVKSGAGVYVYYKDSSNPGVFTMTGGTIQNNIASDKGGGVYVDDHANVLLCGTITGNTAVNMGGGVCCNSPITVGGNVNISGNTVGGVANNVFVRNSSKATNNPVVKCTQTNTLGESASVGISSELEGTMVTDVTESRKSCFTSDNGSYTLVFKNNELSISHHQHAWSYKASGNKLTATCTNADCYEAEPTPVTIASPTGTLVYDGQAHGATLSASAIASSTTLRITYKLASNSSWIAQSATPTDAGTYRAYITLANGKVTGAYTEYTIAKRLATLTSANDSKPYDGTQLTNDTVTVTGFVDGEGATYDVTGTLTKVGTATNTFTYTLNSNTKASNYTIAKVEGVLTVNKAEGEITITADSNYKTYDGTVLTDDGYNCTGSVKNGDTLTVTVVGSITNVGTASNVISAYKIMRGDEDVTDCYVVATASGILTVTKRPVTVTATDVTVNYGTETDLTYIHSDLGQGVALNIKLTRADNEKPATYTIIPSENGANPNYDITFVKGTYTINPKVTFYPQNGSGTSSSSFVAYNTAISAPAVPSRTDYEFIGWYTDSECTTAYNFSKAVTGNTNLFGGWVKNTVDVVPEVSGGLECTGNPDRVENATVELKQGCLTLAATTADGDGNFTFNNVAEGKYNLVITKGDKVSTILCTVTDTGTLNATVPANGSTQVITTNTCLVVDNLDKATTTSTAHVKLYVDTTGSESVTTEQRAIRSKAYGMNLTYVDATLMVNAQEVATSSDVLTIMLDYDTTRKGVTVYRYHDGKAQAFTKVNEPMAVPVDGNYYVDTANGWVYVYAQYFSTYAVGYVPQGANRSGGGGGYSTTVSATLPMLRRGNTGEYVKLLQTKLNSFGYTCVVDGIFGSETYGAVVKFQKAKGIQVDGIVGKETWGKLGVTGTTVKVGATTAIIKTGSSSNSQTTLPILHKGNTGEYVKLLQTKLNSFGYTCVVDGIFGSETYGAVVDFQYAKGIVMDGVVGKITWGRLGY